MAVIVDYVVVYEWAVGVYRGREAIRMNNDTSNNVFAGNNNPFRNTWESMGSTDL